LLAYDLKAVIRQRAQLKSVVPAGGIPVEMPELDSQAEVRWIAALA